MKENPIALVIDDEIQMRRLLRIVLEGAGYVVHEADSGKLGLSDAACRRPDAIILDLGLPDLDGLKVLQALREWSRVPVLILSVRQDAKDKVAALDLGADDYVTKPFHAAELLARLRAIMRHSPLQPESPVFQAAHLVVDFLSRKVTSHGKEVHLTATEYALLSVLIRHAGKVITHSQLLREVWGPHSEGQPQYLRVYMTHLRKKIETDPSQPRLIKTEPGIGYRLVAD